jgi:hypothetical protein
MLVGLLTSYCGAAVIFKFTVDSGTSYISGIVIHQPVNAGLDVHMYWGRFCPLWSVDHAVEI